MIRVRVSRRRLALAATAALAVTAGTLTAGPATGVPAASVQASAHAAVRAASPVPPQNVPFPVDGTVVGVGPTGFLSSQSGPQLTWRWTRFADGATTVLPEKSYRSAGRTDIVANNDGSGVHKLYDMGTGADPVEIVGVPPGSGRTVVGFTTTGLLVQEPGPTGGTVLHVVGEREGVPFDHTVTGLPDDAFLIQVKVDSPGTALVLFSTTVDGVKRYRAAVVDLAAHKVVEEYETAEGAGHPALSATHIAWSEKREGVTTKIALTRRGSGATVRHDMGTKEPVVPDLIGDWWTHRQSRPVTTWSARPEYALYARSLATGETVKLLEHTVNAAIAPGGTQVVRGGTLEHGEGLYRISPGADGARPTVALVASTGQPTALELKGHDVPDTIDLSRPTEPIMLRWKFSKYTTRTRVELVHTASQKTWKAEVGHFEGAVVGFPWDGVYAKFWNRPGNYSDGVPAPNGAYTWRITAQPHDGIGPAVEKTGAFTVVRDPEPHDFDDDGAPDLLARSDFGELYRLHTSIPLGSWPRVVGDPIAEGWGVYDELLAPGDVTGDRRGDVVTRDRSGVLWLHPGTGTAFAPRVRVGGGWQVYAQLTGGSDLTGDGRPDLVATDRSGVLWTYRGTGNVSAPFAPRVRTGHGWNIYNEITSVGNVGGGPAGDLVARDKAGVLWLYLGKGDGTFAQRALIGRGWNVYADILGFGDADHDGRPDLVGVTSEGKKPFLYRGTGNWKVPFQPRGKVYSSSYDYVPGTVF
ncbi:MULTISPECIES: FG-GAP repeat domain-containing protein [unclassified Streptomyces]|uniref:FG-GAP repeat domain-containing protein n=1 Tax=unclassified Streptomyces TaxID=2593676 RepID=UPI0037FBC533